MIEISKRTFIEDYWYSDLFAKTKDNVNIRKCVIECLNSASEATNSSFTKSGVNIKKDVYTEDYDTKLENTQFLVMFVDSEPVGCAEIYKDHPVLHIKTFAILKKYRNRGYAITFLKNTIKHFREILHYKEFRLKVASHNEAAINLYKYIGFEPFSMMMTYRIGENCNERID